MKPIGTYSARRVFWFDYDKFQLDQLPTKNWLCLATSDIEPNKDRFEEFIRHSIDHGILEFKGHGQFGERLHDIFDEIMVDIEISRKVDFIDIGTTCHNGETLADAFWQCFFATALPVTADMDNISIVCTDIEGTDRSNEMELILGRFEKGWIPED
ncbi:MAG: hypothetical protein IPF95_10730 [Flavobacteriales bacterium]|nr:hypothetical protein [Flavobacteriales bacterium]MBK6943087.1 hypothetical protein [Flavobacteriales bacterium]MBK9534605.1 hypothetical protein [Flavobacteriales bacterium]